MNAARCMVLAPLLALAALAVGADGDAEALAARDAARATAARMLAAYVFIAHGSGVVVAPDGLVLTNHHVVAEDLDDGVTSFPIRFPSGATMTASVCGLDPVGDLAVLRIADARSLPCAPLADAGALVPGTPVWAVGDPFGLGENDRIPSLSRGVLSAGRLVRDDYTDTVQLDAPVNPGNSGGPLFDRDGRLLGINGQIRTLSGMRVNSGVGLAIACTQLRAFLPVLRDADGGYVHHTAKPKELTFRVVDGVVVVGDPGAGGLLPGDALLTIAGRPVPSVAVALGLFASLPWIPEATVPVRIRRDGAVREMQVPAARQPIPGRAWHGMATTARTDGVVVTAVEDGSPAARAGVRSGDRIATVNDRPIAKGIDLLKALVPLEPGDRVTLLLRGDAGVERRVDLRLGRR